MGLEGKLSEGGEDTSPLLILMRRKDEHPK